MRFLWELGCGAGGTEVPTLPGPKTITLPPVSMEEFMTKLGTINLKASRRRGLSSEALTA